MTNIPSTFAEAFESKATTDALSIATAAAYEAVRIRLIIALGMPRPRFDEMGDNGRQVAVAYTIAVHVGATADDLLRDLAFGADGIPSKTREECAKVFVATVRSVMRALGVEVYDSPTRDIYTADAAIPFIGRTDAASENVLRKFKQYIDALHDLRFNTFGAKALLSNLGALIDARAALHDAVKAVS